jgi:glyoxylate reductase
MATVAVTSPLPGGALGRLASAHTVRARAPGPGLHDAALAAFAADADALVTLLADGVGAQLFAACPRLRVVANVAVGVDNIDLDAARAAGIWVTNTPDVLTDATADLAVALILTVTRRVVEGDRLMRAGAFTGWRPDFLLGAGLQARTLGIVGMGRIGRAVARRATAFGMRVSYHDPREMAGDEAPGVEYVADVDRLLTRSDILSLHCPLTAATYRLLDARRLHLLPRGAFVINTSRGEVVDEAALADALEEGHLAGAGLDVYEREPEVCPRLLRRVDVVLLPHIGSATWEARTAMADLAIDNVLAVLANQQPPTPVVSPDVSPGPVASGRRCR